MKRKKNQKKKQKKECKIENVNNFSLRSKIAIIIFIISHQMYYTDFYYISTNGDIEHKINEGLYPGVVLTQQKKKKITSHRL